MAPLAVGCCLHLLLAISMVTTANVGADKTPLYIGGFFPLENLRWDASGLLPAAELAIEDVNNSTDLLRDYDLRMVWNDTQCDVGVGMAGLFDQINRSPRKLMLLGAGCTVVTSPMAETAQYWNLVQISHTSSSPSLNDRQKYPFLFRLYPSEESVNFPRLALMKQFGWKKAALLYSSEGSFSQVIQHMRDLLTSNDMEPTLLESFSDDPTPALQNIKSKESRIIIANMFESTARRAFCKAYGLGMTDSGYVWIIPGWFTERWWLGGGTSCTDEEMSKAVEGYFSLETQVIEAETKVTDGGRTPTEFLKVYGSIVEQTEYKPHDLAPFAYDSVFTIATALNKSIEPLKEQGFNLEDFDYSHQDIARVLFAMVNSSDISGITGPIRFDVNGKRLGYTRVEQLQDGVERMLGLFDDSSRDFRYLNNSQIVWSTESGDPPPDGPIEIVEWRTVSLPILLTMTVIAAAGVIFVIFILVVNITQRNRRIMKLSSPNLNYLICVGGFFMYDYVILLGLDSTILHLDQRPSDFFVANCIVKQWLLPVSFSLSFGATFAKAWRIHRIFSNSKMKKRTIKDVQLIIIVVVLLILDAILLVTWDVVDRPMGVNTSLPQENRDRDVIISPWTEHCHSEQENVWIGIFFGYKGLLLLYGAFLAWENRVVKIDVLSDARNIGITIYSTVVLCCVVAPVALVFKEEIDFAYASLAGSINFATSVMLALCFLPKIHIIFTNSVSTENILINNMMNMSQRNAELQTEDRLISDLKQKIKELEASNLKLKQAMKKDRPDIEEDRSSSLVRHRRSNEAQLVLEPDTIPSPETENVRQEGNMSDQNQTHL